MALGKEGALRFAAPKIAGWPPGLAYVSYMPASNECCEDCDRIGAVCCDGCCGAYRRGFADGVEAVRQRMPKPLLDDELLAAVKAAEGEVGNE